VVRKQRPPLWPNWAAVAVALPGIALLGYLSGVWWLIGLVAVAACARVVLWILAPYKQFARKALMPRPGTPDEQMQAAIDPYRRIPVIGWLMRLGAWLLGSGGSH
jgi:hypothetical protein